MNATKTVRITIEAEGLSEADVAKVLAALKSGRLSFGENEFGDNFLDVSKRTVAAGRAVRIASEVR